MLSHVIASYRSYRELSQAPAHSETKGLGRGGKKNRKVQISKFEKMSHRFRKVYQTFLRIRSPHPRSLKKKRGDPYPQAAQGGLSGGLFGCYRKLSQIIAHYRSYRELSRQDNTT